VVALAVTVMDRTLVRVGNQRYSDQNDSYGLTTLTCDHIAVDGGHVHLEFAGKGGSDRQVVFSDRRLSSLVSRCQELNGQTLFSFQTDGGDTASITSTDINQYLAEAMNDHFTAKDFRTWGASSLACAELSCGTTGSDEERLREAIGAVAERLGNTPAVCRSSYLHPAVLEAYEQGSLRDFWRRARPGTWIDRSESALRMVLEAAPQKSLSPD
jgi:DNA topoisomerase-1